MKRHLARTVAGSGPLLLLLGACAPDAPDDGRQDAAIQAARPSSSATVPSPSGLEVEDSVVPHATRPADVVTPSSAPDPVLAPNPPAAAGPRDRVAPPDRAPPPVWPEEPLGSRVTRPDAAPLGIPNRPPASWRH